MDGVAGEKLSPTYDLLGSIESFMQSYIEIFYIIPASKY